MKRMFVDDERAKYICRFIHRRRGSTLSLTDSCSLGERDLPSRLGSRKVDRMCTTRWCVVVVVVSYLASYPPTTDVEMEVFLHTISFLGGYGSRGDERIHSKGS
jgi:hypothetical protein